MRRSSGGCCPTAFWRNCPAVCSSSVFRSTTTAIHEGPSSHGRPLRVRGVRAGAAWCVHSVLPGAHGWRHVHLPFLGVVDAAMLTSATALMLLFAVRRKIALHRQWATRSYAIALVFIAGRFVMGITGWEQLGIEMVQAIIWSCLALSVVLADVSIHWREIRGALSVSVKSARPSGHEWTRTSPTRRVKDKTVESLTGAWGGSPQCSI